MATVFPELANVRIDYCWGGRVDITADRLPRAGERHFRKPCFLPFVGAWYRLKDTLQ